MSTFFRFYWFVNIGGFLAFSLVVYVQQEISFAIGYLIPLVSMVIAVTLFVLPTRIYKNKPPGGKERVCGLYLNSCAKKKLL